MTSFALPRKFPLLPRKKKSDKSCYGHTLLVAGSKGMTGAAILTSRAALKSGSGLVTLGTPRGIEDVTARSLVEVMQLGLPQTAGGSLNVSAFAPIARFVKKRRINSLVIGPGLSVRAETTRLVRRLVRSVPVPTVLDADGLNSFRGKSRLLAKHAAPLVLTPHDNEFERVFGRRPPSAGSGRASLAKKVSRLYDIVLVLKGHRTLVAEGPRLYVNRTGNPGMAKGGTGDVLTGILAAFIAQGLKPFEAACWAVYFHGKAGDLAVRMRGELGLTAGDLLDFLPTAFKSRR